MALLPLVPQTDLTLQPPPCEVAIELQVKAPLSWGKHEWRLMTREVEEIWAPYGLSVCWDEPANPCPGWELRLRVLVADALPATVASARLSQPVVGRIFFTHGGPDTDIAVSVSAARGLVARAKLGDRRLEGWPNPTWNSLVPRVLGRALAHEIGHYMLASEGHSRTGLMAPSFRPDQVTWGPTAWFRLTSQQAASLHVRCNVPVRTGGESAAQIGGVPPMSHQVPTS
jgi:hypothetical protein